VAARYGVRSIPNFAVFRDGSLVWQRAGLMRHLQLEQAVLEQA
jgi:thioredoxin 2